MIVSQVDHVRSKKEIEKELRLAQEQIESQSSKINTLKEEVFDEKKASELSPTIFALFKHVMDENKKTTLILQSIYEKTANIDNDLAESEYQVEGLPNALQVMLVKQV